jgi:hypothetical protein
MLSTRSRRLLTVSGHSAPSKNSCPNVPKPQTRRCTKRFDFFAKLHEFSKHRKLTSRDCDPMNGRARSMISALSSQKKIDAPERKAPKPPTIFTGTILAVRSFMDRASLISRMFYKPEFSMPPKGAVE